MKTASTIRTGRDHRGFTLVEAIMSMLIVSVLLVAAMQAAASAALVQFKTAERLNGRMLAEGLLNDILPLSYEDPNSAVTFGPESGESNNSKSAYDDVDDFNGWTESPPQDKDGTSMTNMTGWQRTVTVERVNPNDLSQVFASETYAKRITVTVRRSGRTVATRVAIRTSTS